MAMLLMIVLLMAITLLVLILTKKLKDYWFLIITPIFIGPLSALAIRIIESAVDLVTVPDPEPYYGCAGWICIDPNAPAITILPRLLIIMVIMIGFTILFASLMKQRIDKRSENQPKKSVAQEAKGKDSHQTKASVDTGFHYPGDDERFKQSVEKAKEQLKTDDKQEKETEK